MLSLFDDKNEDQELSNKLLKLKAILKELKQNSNYKLETSDFILLSTDIINTLREFNLDPMLIEKLDLFFNLFNKMQHSILEKSQDNLYQSDNYTIVLRQSFDLMSMLMQRIPDENYLQYRPRITTEPYIEKDQIINALSVAFNAKLMFLPTSSPLLASGTFSPASAAFTSAASFERQFLNKVKDCSLVDFFELFKTNIQQALKVLDRKSLLEPEQLSIPMQYTHQATTHNLITMRDQSFPANFIYITGQEGTQEMQYTVPLAYHALNITITHPTDSPLIRFHLQFFGEPRDRLMLMKQYMSAYLALNAESVTLPPTYSEEQWHLESHYTIDGMAPNALTCAIHMINDIARMSFFDHKLSLNHILSAGLQSKHSGEALSNPLLELITLFQQSKSSFLTKEDVSLSLALLKTKDLSPQAAKKLITLVNTKLTRTLRADVDVSEQLLVINQFPYGNDCDSQPSSSSSSDSPSTSSQKSKRPPTRFNRKR